ncbi:MAG TPA: histidine phosphatase family protein [Nocardioides sp.]|uniref:histidine phosphatase family protein n=1 Tax=Nocardioides sp. TaxID=35761 RepID=UPI002C290142|nr:histidine phosphatase family protein [Nocardioides sp.]HQR26201.1 histidine phosphatase family protein [Nocardioides sp.]
MRLADGEVRRLVLLRHGRTPWNLIDRAQGHTDVQLDDCGHAQARAAASCLAGQHPVRLWTSDLARARQTAAYLEEATGLVAQPDRRLREFDVGVRSGLTRTEFAERHPAEYAAWVAGEPGPLVPGEESVEQVRARVTPALTDCLAALGPGETGIAVLHGTCVKVGLFAVLGWPPVPTRSLRVLANGAWAVLVQGPDDPLPRLAAYNLAPRRQTEGADFASSEGVG